MNFLNREQREQYEQIPADTPFIFHPSLAGTALELQGKLHFSEVRSYNGRSLFCSRFSRLSRLEIERTLPLNSMNREHSEGYEQGEADQTNFSRLSRVSRLKIQRTLPFLFAVFARFAVIFSSELQRTLRLNSMNREQRERYEQEKQTIKLSRLSR